MFLYIDPGTGSMLFSVLIGLAAALLYFFRGLLIKLKFSLSAGQVEKNGNTTQYAIFAESKRYWNVFEPVCDEFEKRKTKAEYLTTSRDDPVFDRGYRYVQPVYIGEGNKAFAKLNFLKADIVLSTTPGLQVLQWKRSKDVKWYVHILHATGSITGYRMFGIDYYDALLLSGTFQVEEVRKLEELRELPAKETVIAGMTYLDRLQERLDRSKQEPEERPEAKKETTILLAPSWGPSSILCKYGSEILNCLVSTGYNLIIRPHPQSFTADQDIMDRLISAFPDNEKLHWDRTGDNYASLLQSDLMITDFSGIIFDYTLVFDKPVIYANAEFDDGPYDSYWLEQPRKEFELLPRLGRELRKEDFADIKMLIDDLLTNDTYAKSRKAVKETTWAYQGEAAKRVVDYLTGKNAQLNEGCQS